MKLGVILPHTKLFGGVKRFFELGNIFIDKGHEFFVFTPEGLAPNWFDFNGKVNILDSLPSYSLDALFFVEVKALTNVLEAKAKNKIFYHVTTKGILKDILSHKDITIFANSTNVYNADVKRYGIKPIKAFGGVHCRELTTKIKKHSNTINIMVFGRLNRKNKGTHIVIKACERLYKRNKNIKLLLFDSPTDTQGKELIEKFTCKLPYEFIVNHPTNKNYMLFERADIFVSAERRGGWCNTCIEALAANVPIIATKTGTNDFLIPNETGLLVNRNSFSISRAINKLLKSEDLRNKLATNGRKYVKKFDWKILANNISKYLEDKI